MKIQLDSGLYKEVDALRVVGGAGVNVSSTEVPGDTPDLEVTLASNFIELGYAEVTTNLSITSTAESSPDDVVSLPARTYSGTEIVLIEFFCYDVLVAANAAGNGINVNLWDMDGPTNLGRMAAIEFPSAAIFEAGLSGRFRTTPAAGQHTYRARAWRRNAACTLVGNGGIPIYLRASRVG